MVQVQEPEPQNSEVPPKRQRTEAPSGTDSEEQSGEPQGLGLVAYSSDNATSGQEGVTEGEYERRSQRKGGMGGAEPMGAMSAQANVGEESSGTEDSESGGSEVGSPNHLQSFF
ncbi:unnamed protein product [Ostreobium quekettii]|uniref:Uncharacterized protein n=1 Tax=Ostreobium quekettii TaxID=121088 RepID=A0A8S1INZ4_9CHLO|nr:unnamed protein product [Ostreobium quekettii]